MFCFNILLTFSSVYGFETFTPANQFSIPENASTVNFANSGSYESVDFENNSWTFVSLIFDNFVLNLTTIGGGYTHWKRGFRL